jgi:hypothetical protein
MISWRAGKCLRILSKLAAIIYSGNCRQELHLDDGTGINQYAMCCLRKVCKAVAESGAKLLAVTSDAAPMTFSSIVS